MSIINLIVDAFCNIDPNIVAITFHHLDIFCINELKTHFEYTIPTGQTLHTEPMIQEHTKHPDLVYYEVPPLNQGLKSKPILHIIPSSNENPVPKPTLHIVPPQNKEPESVVQDELEKEKSDLKEELSEDLIEKSTDMDVEEELNKIEKKFRHLKKSKKKRSHIHIMSVNQGFRDMNNT